MDGSTFNTISTIQNTERAQRLLAAQSRLYTEAKRLHDARVLTVIVLAVITVVAAFVFPPERINIGVVGGVITFLWSVLGSRREKHCRQQAAFVQEEFDTYVFDMPWNDLAAEHPSPTLIAEAATRYRGNRTKDWYPDTGSVIRPLDVLICQRSNLGWGASIHRVYATVLTVILVCLLLIATVCALVANLATIDSLIVIFLPLLGPVRELIEMIRNNRDSSNTKTTVEEKIHSLWERALRSDREITISDCRAVQDQILIIRQTNAHVPDCLDNFHRARNEKIMQQSAAHLIDEAVSHGKTR